MFVFKRALFTNNVPNKLQKGYWRKFGMRAICACPDCGLTAVLQHEVDDYGVITPSVECPNEECSFHEMCRLEGWIP